MVRGPTSGQRCDTGTNLTSTTVTGLPNGTAYTFSVAATNSWGTGPTSAPSVAATPATQPGAPGTPAVTGIGNGSISLTWSVPASDGGAAIVGYAITPYVGTVAQTSISTGSPSTTFTVNGLGNGTSYTFTVAATNSLGTGAASAASTAATPAAAPDAPASVAATATSARALLTWIAPANNGAPITGYQVTPYVAGVAQAPISTNSTNPSFLVTGLANGTTYTFTVTATNSIGSGPASTASNAVTPGTVPAAPAAPTATAGNGSVALSWSAPADTGGFSITSYRIVPYVGASAQTAITTGSAATTWTVTGLTNGTTYTFTVAATNAAGTGAASSASGGVTPAGPPTAPQLVKATAGDGTVTLTWQAPSSGGGSAVTGYVVTPHAAGVSQTAINLGNVSSDTVTGLANGTRYQLTVAATNSSGTGPTSSSNAVTPSSGTACLGTPIFSDLPVVTAHTTPVADAVGDFNGDGLADLAIANNGSGDVSILMGNGDGTFGTAANDTVTSSLASVLAPDLNGDGLSDLVLTAATTNNVYVMINNGDGTFPSPTSYTPAGTSSPAVAVGDFNGDGHVDVAAGSGTHVSIFLGTGTGSLGSPTTLTSGPAITSITVSNFNSDSALDVAVAGAGTIGIWLGNGDGTFKTQKTSSVGGTAAQIAAGDFNKDGRTDVAVTTSGNDIIYTLAGNGDGTFGAALTNYDNNPTRYVSAADFNGDGYADLVVTNSGNTSILQTSSCPTHRSCPCCSDTETAPSSRLSAT